MAGLLAAGELKVLVDKASDLEQVVSNQQPYYVLECGPQRCRSRVAPVGGAAAPQWRRAHRFALSGDDMVLRVSCTHYSA